MNPTSAWQNCLVMPYTMTTEAKAEQFADALEVVFLHGVKTEVFEDGGKWGVAIVEGQQEVTADPIDDEAITAVALMLIHYDLAPKTGDVDCVAQSTTDIPAAHEAMTRQARRSFRIEDKLDRILATLDGVKPIV